MTQPWPNQRQLCQGGGDILGKGQRQGLAAGAGTCLQLCVCGGSLALPEIASVWCSGAGVLHGVVGCAESQ